MGWTRVAELQITEKNSVSIIIPGSWSQLSEGAASLWSRGGINGVEVHIGPYIVEIPLEVLRKLIADEIRDRHISSLEEMDTAGILAKFLDI